MTFRAFIAAEVGPRDEFERFQRGLRKTGAPMKLVELKNLHITLKFLGDIEEAKVDDIVDAMAKATQDNGAFHIKFTGCGAFPSMNYIKVVWIGVDDGENLVDIAVDLDERLNKLGFKKEKNKFSPHLTMARVKSAKGKDELVRYLNSQSDNEFGELHVGSIKLMKSELTPQGPIYECVEEIPL